MAVTLPEIKERNLNDFVLGTLRAFDKGKPTDIITPKHPIFDRLVDNGNAGSEPPGQGPVEDVVFVTPDRSTVLSLSNDFKERPETPIDAHTTAQYDWIQLMETLTIPKFKFENIQGALGLGIYIERQRKVIERAEKNKLVDWLWDGRSSGVERIFGLKDSIRFVPGTEPSQGSIGRLAISQFPTWQNQSKDFSDAYKTISSGTMTKTFIDDPDVTVSLADLYLDCSNNTDNSAPDILAVNQTCMKMFQDLNREGLMVRDDQANFQRGFSGFKYLNADVVWDPKVPDDPNDASFGVGMFINTEAMRVLFADGITKKWGEMYKNVKTAFSWDRTTQIAITYDDLSKMGVIFGLEPASVS